MFFDFVCTIGAAYGLSCCSLIDLSSPPFDNPQVGFIQSPQDYRDRHQSTFKEFSYWEYAGFFNIGMVQRNEYNGREEAQAVLCAMLDHGAIGFADWHSEFSAAISDAPPVPGEPLDEAKVDDRRGEEPFAVLADLADRSSSIALAVNDPVAWRGSATGIREIKPALAALQVLAFDDPALAAGNFDHVVMAEPPPAPALAGSASAHAVFRAPSP